MLEPDFPPGDHAAVSAVAAGGLKRATTNATAGAQCRGCVPASQDLSCARLPYLFDTRIFLVHLDFAIHTVMICFPKVRFRVR